MTIAENTHSLSLDTETPVSVRMRTFVDQRIIPCEQNLYVDDIPVAQLRELAQDLELWGSFLPRGYGGYFFTLSDYLSVAEEEGRSEFGPVIMGSDTALDIRFLCEHADTRIKHALVPQLLAGETVAFAATEPDVPGSIPARIQACARWCGDHWSLTGRKWFVSRASDAVAFMVLAHIEDDEQSEPESAVFVIPADNAGVRRVGRQTLLGRDYGQCELAFDRVSLEPEARLGLPGQTPALLEQRLLVGRTVRAMHWVGLARRCLELLCARLVAPRASACGLADKQLLRAALFEVHQSVASARLLVREAARAVQEGEAAAVAVNSAKIAATRALSQAVDSAVQVWGAEGLLDKQPLSGIYRYARATRMMDGPDEALISAVGRSLLRDYRERAHV